MDPLCAGTFVHMEPASGGAVEAYTKMGIPKADAELMLDPASKTSYEVTLSEDRRTITWKETYPVVPQYNASYTIVLGETLVCEKPIALSLLITKRDSTSWNGEMTTGTFTHKSLHVFSGAGITLSGSVEDTEYSAFFTRQAPEVSSWGDTFPRSAACSCLRTTRVWLTSWWLPSARTGRRWRRPWSGAPGG